MRNNATWGNPLAPYVDKYQAKVIVEGWSPSVDIIPSYAVLDESNYMEIMENATARIEFLKTIPQPFIMKATHASGNVVLVHNDTFDCVKLCDAKGLDLYSEQAGIEFKKRIKHDMSINFAWRRAREMQYDKIPRRIIFEQALDMKDEFNDVTFWYIAGGKPVYTSLECDRLPDGTKRRVFFSPAFERLDMKLAMDPCPQTISKPPMWDKMLQVAQEIAPHMPQHVIRLDLYSSHTRVVFSELTFTSAACRRTFLPLVADGLLYALSSGLVDPEIAGTPEFIQKTVMDRSWVKVSMDHRQPAVANNNTGYPSAVDLCFNRTSKPIVRGPLPQSARNDPCLQAAATVQHLPLRCVITTKNEPPTAVGTSKEVSLLGSFFNHVDLDRVLVLLGLLYYFCHMNPKFLKRDDSQWIQRRFVPYLCCLVGIGTYMFFSTNHSGLTSGMSIAKIVQDSYGAFTIVHPMQSVDVALSHFGTYWFLVAAWFSRDLKHCMVWLVLYETVTATVNEYTHHHEEDNAVQCMRVAFIHTMRRHVLDDLIRVYILPPIFVYLYLLPKFLLHFLFGLF